jgi:protein-disulfide isomerase
LAAALICALPAAAAEPLAGPKAPDRAEIEKIVRDYIVANPEVILESLRAYEFARRQESEKEAQAALVSNREQLERNPAAPVAGNVNGDVTVVEFFDYQCGYCKRVIPTIQELLKTDPKVRYVFKEFPILGPESVVAAKAALAVWSIAPEKYLPFHVALMQSRGGLSEERIFEVGKSVGVDDGRLRTAMADPKIEEQLRRNLELGRAINVNGTPAFVIGGRLVPGAIDLETMRQLVAAARAG